MILNVTGDVVTEQKLLEILNQLSNGGSAVQIFITNALTNAKLYQEFILDRMCNEFLLTFIVYSIFYSIDGSTLSL